MGLTRALVAPASIAIFMKKKPSPSSKPKFGKPNKKLSPALGVREDGTIRLNKYVASTGLCSRRKADEYIKNGRIKVNGEVVREMGHRFKPEEAEVHFDDRLLRPEEELVYILLNKPKNTITTASDEKGRRTVLDIVGDACEQRIFPVGRLDRPTTGLLLLTNDGDLSLRLTHPSFEIKKVYRVTLDKEASEADLEKIRNTLELEDGPAPVDKVSFVKGGSAKEVGIELHIGRNRIVRRIFAHLGYTVVKLDRVLYGPLTKKGLKRGYYRFLTEKEVTLLKHF